MVKDYKVKSKGVESLMKGYKGDGGYTTVTVTSKGPQAGGITSDRSYPTISGGGGGGGGGGSSGDGGAAARAAEAARKAAADAAAKVLAERIAREAEFLRKTKAAEQKRAAEQLKKIVSLRRNMTNKYEQAVLAREELRVQAIIRGKAYSRLEAERFLKSRAGQDAITNLRAANRSKGYVGDVQTIIKGGAQMEEARKSLISRGLSPGVDRYGQITGFTSPDTKKSYPYNEDGIKAYEKDAKTGGALIREVFRKKKDTDVTTLYDTKSTAGQIKNLVVRYQSEIDNAKKTVLESKSNNEIQRLAELQRKRGLTAAERAEKKRLGKSVARSYRLSSEVISKTALVSLINLGFGVSSFSKVAIKKPEILLTLPTVMVRGIKNDFNKIKSGRSFAALEVITEYAVLGGAMKVVGVGAKAALRTLARLSPKYVRLVAGQIKIRKAPKEIFKVRGKERLLKSRVQRASFKRPFSSIADFLKRRKPGQFKRFTKDPGLILKTQTVASGASPLSAQAQLAGKEVTAVNAAAEQLTSWLRRKEIIRKSIPGEEAFPKKIKDLLNKFDAGRKLTNKEFATVNLWLQKNVAPNITLLERSLYADPASGLRISRLGIQAERSASLRDILKGNFKLWGRQKPQVLIFENAKIAKFPKALASIKKKLLANKPLTVAETNKLIRWQTTTGGGKFKPIGSTIYSGGVELEITLAPGEFVKRIKKVGFSYIQGKKVTFVTAEIYKPTKQLAKQIKLANLGKLTKTSLRKLESILSKKLGRKIRVETPNLRSAAMRAGRGAARRADVNIPVLRIRGGRIFVKQFKNSLRRGATRKIAKKVNKLRARPKTRTNARSKPVRSRKRA